MCDPLNAAIAVLSVVTTAANVVTQVQTANAENKSISESYAAQNKQTQEQETTDINNQLREQRVQAGKIQVAAGQSGLQLQGGVSDLLKDSLMQTQLYGDTIKQNADNQYEANAAQANAAFSRVQKPTLLGAGLQIASAGVGAYASASSRSLLMNRAAPVAQSGSSVPVMYPGASSPFPASA